MDVLNRQTPEMNEKQLWMGHLLAYNVIRLLMAQAGSNADVDRRSCLSFKHTVQQWTQWAASQRTLLGQGAPDAVRVDRPMQGR